jgi:hypothetical protein
VDENKIAIRLTAVAMGFPDVVNQISRVVAQKTNAAMSKIITPWITGGLSGNTFFTSDIKNIKFSYKDNDDMFFSAKVLIVLPDEGREGWKTYRWKLRGKKYTGKISRRKDAP